MHSAPEQGLSLSKPLDVDRAVKLLYASLLLGIVVGIADFSYLKSLRSASFTLLIFLFTLGSFFF